MLGCLSLSCRHLSEQLLLETLSAEGLSSPPAARITDDLLVLIIDGDGVGVGFHRQSATDVTCRHTVTVAVEGQPEILMHQRFDTISIIERETGKWTQAFRTKAF